MSGTPDFNPFGSVHSGGDGQDKPVEPTEPPLLPLTEIPLSAGYGVRGPWFELYFTNPTSPLASQETGGPDGPLAAAIDEARLSVDAAIFSLSLNSIRDALRRAYDRGVRVRVVMESDNLDEFDPQVLVETGIPVLGDRREGLMHNKFVVIDNSEVWTGSMNFTTSGAYEDNNNLIRIRSAEIAADYTKEFEEMFKDDLFGADVLAETPNSRVHLYGIPIDIYFSPDDSAADGLLDLVMNAKENITFMAYSFTSDPLGAAVRERAAENVKVRGVMDDGQLASNLGSEYDAFRQAGLDVRLDGSDSQMHHKVLIIDRQVVLTGSYNFTASAEERNDENLLVIYNAAIAQQFLVEFQRIYDQARP